MVAEVCQPQALSLSLPDSSSADLNGDLWFFPFLITVHGVSRQISLRREAVSFLAEFLLAARPLQRPVSRFSALRDGDVAPSFLFSLERREATEEPLPPPCPRFESLAAQPAIASLRLLPLRRPPRARGLGRLPRNGQGRRPAGPPAGTDADPEGTCCLPGSGPGSPD